MKYTVELWGSDPALNNDDCHSGQDFDDLAKAEEFYANPFINPDQYAPSRCVAVITLVGPGVDKQRNNPEFKPDRRVSVDREFAMQAGMMGGVAAYNDAYGY
jgi:hypothetical protein